MPIIKSAIKRMKQTTVRRARNVETKKAVKTAVRAFTDKPSAKTLSEAQSAIDTAVKKNVLSKGTAARRKSSLVKIAKEAGVKPVTAAKKAAPKAAEKKASAAKAAAKKPAATKAPAKKPATKKPAAKK
jgi:ribosomal protein S20